MFDLREISERIARVRRMGHAVGVDLDSAIGEGGIARPEAQAAVRRCLTCAAPDDCAEWLEDYPDGASLPPGYCRNGHLFLRLGAGDRGGG